MAAIDTCWLVGSFTLAEDADVTVNGNDHTVSAGTYYLRDATNGNSLIYQLQTAIAAEVPGSTVHIGADRILRIVSGAGALTLAIPSELQAVTGLAASPSVGTTVAADEPSTLLWSPGWPETSTGHPSGVTGRPVYDRVQTVSSTGLTTRTTLHHAQTLAEWSWFSVDQSRAWTTDGGEPGEFRRFWQDVLLPGENFKLYPEISEDATVTTTVTWTTALGPYVASGPLPSPPHKRKVANSDEWVDIELSAHVVTEISN